MQGLKRLQEAIERHRENKDINIKYKTPLTSKSLWAKPGSRDMPSLLSSTPHFADDSPPAVRNVNTFTDEQAIDDACNPIRCDRHVRISEWVRGVQRVGAA